MFLMAHPGGDFKLSDVNLISYDMIKLSKCCGLYNKYIEMAEKDQRRQEDMGNLCQHLIKEYEKMLEEGGGTNLSQEG